MKKNKHQLAAFTIMELTVAMLISAIVIAITYTAYSMVSGSYISYTNKHNEMAVLVRLDELLKKDFSKADFILEDRNILRLNNSQQFISYKFEAEQIIRTSIITDTFKVASSDLLLSFESRVLAEEPSDDEEENRVDELSFTVDYNHQKFPYHYYKQYSATNLMNRHPNAIN